MERSGAGAPPDAEGPWFINDHCFIAEPEGVLHMFCINDPYPPEGRRLYDYHPYLGHATSEDPTGTWQRQPFVLDESEGTEYLGAPFVVRVEGDEMYAMLFEAKHDGRRVLEVAWSRDLFAWERSGRPIAADLPEAARDPCVLRDEDGAFTVYLCTPHPEGSTINMVRTRDFRSFDPPKCCLQVADGVSCGGMESPFVLRRKGLYYLLTTYAHRHYYETIVIVSDRPDRFSMDCAVTTLYGHAAEIFSYEGRSYISSCGPEDMQKINGHGLYLAELGWLSPGNRRPEDAP